MMTLNMSRTLLQALVDGLPLPRRCWCREKHLNERDMDTALPDGTLQHDVVFTLCTLAKKAGPWLRERALPHIDELRDIRILHKGGAFMHKGSYHVWKTCGQTRIAHCLHTPFSAEKLNVYTGAFVRRLQSLSRTCTQYTR